MEILEPAPLPPPWQQTWRGKTWRDMPGNDDTHRRINFFYFRRGRYDLEKKRIIGRPKFGVAVGITVGAAIKKAESLAASL